MCEFMNHKVMNIEKYIYIYTVNILCKSLYIYLHTEYVRPRLIDYYDLCIQNCSQ